MNAILTFLFEAAKKHGIAFLAMLVLVIYFHGQTEKLEKKFDLCNSKVIEMYQDHNTQLIQTLERNSQALERNSQALESLVGK